MLRRETPGFANPHHCGSAFYRWLLPETADQSITGGTCDPAIRDMQIGNVRLRDVCLVETVERRREIADSQNDKGDLRVCGPLRKSQRKAGFQIAFGNQTFSPTVTVALWGRLSALRPYLAAGLPLSVQSLLERTALKESNQVGPTKLNIVQQFVSTVILKAWAGGRN